LDLRSTQISDLQQNILDSNQGTDVKPYSWDALHTMADAKTLLSFLMEKVVALTKEFHEKSFECNEVKEQLDKKLSLVNSLQKQMNQLTDQKNKALSQMEKEYEEKVYVLLRHLHAGHGGTTVNAEVREASEVVQKLEFAKILQILKENQQLKSDLENMKANRAEKPYALKRGSTANEVSKCACINGSSKTYCDCNKTSQPSCGGSGYGDQLCSNEFQEIFGNVYVCVGELHFAKLNLNLMKTLN